MTYNFQQWMSRLPQRWRTQRNAIRNTNCKTSWIIKILNAHCAPRNCLGAYLSECSWTPLNTDNCYLFKTAGCSCWTMLLLLLLLLAWVSAAMKFVTKYIGGGQSYDWLLSMTYLCDQMPCVVCAKQVLLMSCSWTVHFEPALVMMTVVLSADHWVYIRISD